MNIVCEIIIYIFGFIGGLFTIATGYKAIFPTSYDVISSKISIFIARFTKRAEKAAVSRDIQSNMNSTIKELNSEFELPDLDKIEVRWVDNERKMDAFIKSGGKLVLAMEYHHNQDKNILNAARLYVSHCVTNVLQNYSELELKEAVDLTIIKRFLEEEKYEATLRYFFDESFDFDYEIKKKIMEYYKNMTQMQKRGIFTVIYLNELLRVGKIIYPTTEWEDVREELHRFTDFMSNVAHKQRGVDLETLCFKDNNIKMGIVMIGKKDSLERYGIEIYLDWVKQYVEEGIEKIYIMSSGWKKILAKMLLKELEKNVSFGESKIREYSSNEYPDSICIYISMCGK